MSDTPGGVGWWKASDGKWYPSKIRPRPPMKRGRWAIRVLLLAGIAFAGGVWTSLELDLDDRVDSPQPSIEGVEGDSIEGVEIVRCGRDEFGFFPTAELELRNETDARSSYLVTVAFENADGDQLDTGVEIIQALEPGQRGEGEALGSFDSEDFTCRLADVDRVTD